jgi:hypothetical protein
MHDGQHHVVDAEDFADAIHDLLSS